MACSRTMRTREYTSPSSDVADVLPAGHGPLGRSASPSQTDREPHPGRKSYVVAGARPPSAWPTREGGHAVSSHVVLREHRRSRALILAAASVGAVASLALAGPMLAQSEEPSGEVYTINAVTTDL